MSIAENKALIQRFVHEVLNTGDLAAADALLAPDFALHIAGMPEMHGLDAWKQAFGGFRAAIPDMVHTTDELTAEGDKVAMRGSSRGTHRGDLMGIPASGKTVEWSELFVYRIADGRIAEEWGQMDMLGLLQQLGALPAPQHSPA